MISTVFISIFRGFTLYLLILPHPIGKIWFETGVFSFCPFYPNPDYFFSGHINLMSLGAIKAFNIPGSNIYIYIYIGFRKFSIFVLWPAVMCEFFMILVGHIHYTLGNILNKYKKFYIYLDLIYGIITSHYVIMFVRLFEAKLDQVCNQLFDNLAISLAKSI